MNATKSKIKLRIRLMSRISASAQPFGGIHIFGCNRVTPHPMPLTMMAKNYHATLPNTTFYPMPALRAAKM